ncbi:ABC transporter ATP-binding protein [Acidocella sp.]|jgi:sn-glycerol 3-phosphate transport system ATP-binding protein|uniref:ABC transporter ATP-binding protein n=1 Tax=Acidocella sp. TaxID=50710 RepID=UPI002F400611
MSTLELRGLRKDFGATKVLQSIDLTLASGEMLVIVGVSGCGKSTLLRLVAGLETPSDGKILLDGVDITRQDPAKRDIAMVFQNYALYPHMTVAQNMSYALKLRGETQSEITRKVAEAAAQLGLSDLLARHPRDLSGGQRQRVAMGRAIVRQPKMFLFDEPLSNLDAKLRVTMRAEIRRLQQRLKVTSLYVTHDQLEAMTMADRLIVMEAGRVSQIATPMEVFERPANLFVAGFIGAPAMNILQPERAGISDVPVKTLVGIRPEHIKVVDHGRTLTIDLVEPLGAETLIHGTLPCGQRLTLKRPGGPPDVSELQIDLPNNLLHVFDAASGARR